MKEQKIIKKQLIKNMLLNFVTFTIIFTVLGLIIYGQFTSSLYISADEELLDKKNKMGIMQEIKEKNNEENKIPNEALLDDTQNPKPPQKEDIEPEKQEEQINPRLIYIYRDENGKIISNKTNTNNEQRFNNIEFNKNNLETIYEITIDNRYKYRAINNKIEDENGENIYLQVLINVDAENAITQSFKVNLVICIVISLVFSIVASYILSKKTLKPIINSWNKQTEFVQNASHELRTPLTIIQAKQELLLEEPQAKIIDKAEEINCSLNETRRMAKLVKDLMQLARADSNKIELNKENVEIDKWITELVKPFIEMAKIQNKELTLNLNYGKTANIDKGKIHQVMVIILDNALKYTKEGDKIIIHTYEKDAKFVLEVCDTGIGVSDDGLKRIFDRFYREDIARNRQTGGSGLGLSIAKHIINLHGGTIRAIPNQPKGVKIEIKIATGLRV